MKSEGGKKRREEKKTNSKNPFQHLSIFQRLPPFCLVFPVQVCLVASSSGSRGVGDDQAFIDKIWTSIRRRYHNCQIVFMPESNLGKEASHLEQYVQHDHLTVTMREERGGGGGWFGVRKTAVTTLEMHKYMLHALHNKSIGVTTDCIGVPTVAEERTHGIQACSDAARGYMLKKLRTQVLAFHWEPISRASSMDIRHHLTGKGSNVNDDLCISLIMLPYWRQVFIRSYNSNYVQAKINMRLLDPYSKQPLYQNRI